MTQQYLDKNKKFIAIRDRLIVKITRQVHERVFHNRT